MYKKIALTLVAVLLLILAAAMMQPDSFSVQRSIAIKAPPEKIIPLISDFHQWTRWSPWEKLDPAMQRSYAGAARGQGAVYTWKGDSKVGEGRMEVTGVTSSAVAIKLDFLTPFESHNVTDFSMAPAPDGATTTVTWKMSGPSQFMTKLMGLVASMDSMVGKDFEKGLAELKVAAEQ